MIISKKKNPFKHVLRLRFSEILEKPCCKLEKPPVCALVFLDQEQEYLLHLPIALTSDIMKALHPNYR